MNSDIILSTYAGLKAERESWEGWWQTLRHYVLPRRVQPEAGRDVRHGPESDNFDNLYDTTAIEACQRLASGHISYITPGHEVWFKWSAPEEFDGLDHVEAWYNRASEIALRELSASNFYTEIHECFLDRAALGTGSMFCGTRQDGRLLFNHISCGTFACSENEEGIVDTYYREFTFTPYQAERMFGRKNLGERSRALCDDAARKHTASLRFLHVVHPRDKYNPTRKDAANRPFRSVYLSLDDNNIVEEDGYLEFPYLVTRFLKWGEGPYGLPPGRLIFPAIRQAQFLNRILDTLAEVAAFPRILELANQVGEIDFRAGGRTLISPEAAQLGFPREWATGGNYSVGLDRLGSKQEAIKKAFYLPLFDLWGNTTHQMTATEVTARENEKVLMFSPSFTLFVNDFYPTMKRIFRLLYRQGKFPEPPQEIINGESLTGEVIPEPKIVYQSKIALTLRKLQTESFDRTLRRLSAVTPYHPDAPDNFNWDVTIRDTARIEGVPEHFLKPLAKVTDERESRQQEAMAAQAAQAGQPGMDPGMIGEAAGMPDLDQLLNSPLTEDQIPQLMQLL